MNQNKRIQGGSRHGKHSWDVFRVSLYVTAEEKALAALTAELEGKTLTDVLKGGIVSEATRVGILKNGQVVNEHRERVDAYRHILEAEKHTTKGITK